MEKIIVGYDSPRISSEFLDCGLVLSFDNLSNCSFNCLFCFSTYQRGANPACKEVYAEKKVKSVDINKIKALFTGKNFDPRGLEKGGEARLSDVMYEYFIKNKLPLHSGGLSDGFCHFEKSHHNMLEIIKFMDEINYPMIFSTKGIVNSDPEYLEVFKRNPKNWGFQFSITTSDLNTAKIIEAGVPTPDQRLEAMRKLSDIGVKTTLRFRPYVIGYSNKTAVDLIQKAAKAGASAVSTEFACIPVYMTDTVKAKYKIVSEVVGFDIIEYYRRLSVDVGYMRLNRQVKAPYFLEMYRTARENGLDISVSDPDFREFGCSGCCCGFKKDVANYTAGTYTNAIIHARKTGEVRWDFISPHLEWTKHLTVKQTGMPMISEHNKGRDQYCYETKENKILYNYIRDIWNNTNSGKNPYRVFHGKLVPKGVDGNKNIIYKYVRDWVDDEVEKIDSETCGKCKSKEVSKCSQ